MPDLRTIIFTGVSGGGKTTALRAVEDLGYYCIDNLPLPLLTQLIEVLSRELAEDRLALVVDSRLHTQLDAYAQAAARLRQEGHPIDVVYLDAKTDALLRRFSQTRRRHPLESTDLVTGLTEERRLLEPLRQQATLSIDTSQLTPHELKRIIQERFETTGDGLEITCVSFGFRYGLPSYADLVLDVRFLPNPFFVETLRPLSGQDPEVADYVLASEDAPELVRRIENLLRYLLPRYQSEGKSYLTVAIGCTGGRHRSVCLVETLVKALSPEYTVKVSHRDIHRPGDPGALPHLHSS